MNPQKHTPGPWVNAWGKIVDAEGKAICMVTYRKNGQNDALLAAAPELLAALKTLQEMVTKTDNAFHPANIAARAAIARAEGNQS